MKIPQSIRNIYRDNIDNYKALKKLVDNKFAAIREEKWHYESRIKQEESFALKIETGRVTNPTKMEDFLGCMLVVENIKAIGKATEIIEREFNVKEKRPAQQGFTHKSSDSFPFDDIRFYLEWEDSEFTRPTGLNGCIFEVQVKTFLQHAWSLATHDLIYKGNDINWAKERVAYQIKAMLEHAEISIQEVENISKSPVLNKVNKYTQDLINIVDFIHKLWDSNSLPNNKIRLAKNIKNILNECYISVEQLEEIIQRETEAGKGTKTLNLSPYGIIMQSIINQRPKILEKYLKKQTPRAKCVICSEIEIAEELKNKFNKNILYINN